MNPDHYAKLLAEVRQDIADTERKLEDLCQLEKYLLQKTNAPQAPPKSNGARNISGRADGEKTGNKVEPIEQNNVEQPHKSDNGGRKDPGKANPLKTVEFGPDGFPISP